MYPPLTPKVRGKASENRATTLWKTLATLHASRPVKADRPEQDDANALYRGARGGSRREHLTRERCSQVQKARAMVIVESLDRCLRWRNDKRAPGTERYRG